MNRLKLLLLPLLLALGSGAALAQLSTATVSGTLYKPDGSVCANCTIKIVKTYKGGALVSLTPVTVTANGSGVLSFTVPRGSIAWISGNVMGFSQCGAAGCPVSIPDASSASLETLVPSITTLPNSYPVAVAGRFAVKSNGSSVSAAVDTLDFSGRFAVTESPTGEANVELAASGASAGTYTYATVTVDAYGRVTSASSGAAPGTVTSVGLALPNIFTVSGSPVTGAGTLTGTLANQSANQIFAGPTSGAAAAPAFRALVAADIPDLSAVYQPLSGNLTALAALPSTGFAVRTGTNTWAQRTITASSGITITNGNGVSANPALTLNQGFTPVWTALHTFNPGNSTAADDAITLAVTTPGSTGQYDSHRLLWVGYGHDGALFHDAQWRSRVDVTSNAGASTWTLDSALDGAAWASRLSVTDGGTLTATLFSGSGASLTNLNASSLASGTVPAARVQEVLALADLSDVGTLTNGRVPFRSGGVLTDSANFAYSGNNLALSRTTSATSGAVTAFDATLQVTTATTSAPYFSAFSLLQRYDLPSAVTIQSPDDNSPTVTSLTQLAGANSTSVVARGIGFQALARIYEGTFTEYVAFQAKSPTRPSGAGVYGTVYGVLIGDLKQSFVSSAWGIYQQGATTNNYLQGQAGIGTATLTAQLNTVSGATGRPALLAQAASGESASATLAQFNNGSGTAVVTIAAGGQIKSVGTGSNFRFDYSGVTAAGFLDVNTTGSVLLSSNVSGADVVSDSAKSQWRMFFSQSSDTWGIQRSPIGGTWTPTTMMSMNSLGEVIHVGVTFANLGTPSNGAFAYCSDCTIANPCASGGTGAFAKRLNGSWVCN
jgi:hypothetical protein